MRQLGKVGDCFGENNYVADTLAHNKYEREMQRIDYDLHNVENSVNHTALGLEKLHISNLFNES